MWEEGIICLFIFIGGFCILPSNIQKQLVSKKYMFITILAGISLYIFSVYILGLYRRKTESFDLMTTCGSTGGRCSEDKPYCLITEKALPRNELDQTLIFNTYGRYVKMFPSATDGDGYTGLSSLEIFDSTGTNILKGKSVSSQSASDTANPSQQGKLVGDNGGNIRYAPNVFVSPTNDRNTAAWEVDLGQVYMITKIRYIGRGDSGHSLSVGLEGNQPWQNQPRNIGVRFRIYMEPSDVPTTGTCVAKPTIQYPDGASSAEKSVLEPIILAGMDGALALKVYRGIKSNPGTLLTSYGLTDAQAASAYVKMLTANNLKTVMGWNIIGKWNANSNDISVVSGPMPIINQTIFSSNPIDILTNYGENNSPGVFAIKGSFNKAEATTKCSSLNATLATREQLTDAHTKGAGWCEDGWLADSSGLGGHPAQKGTCSNDTVGVLTSQWSTDSKHGAICYGVRPSKDTKDVLYFNETRQLWYEPNRGSDKGTPEKVYAISSGSRVTQIYGRRIQINSKTSVAGNNIGIKLNGYPGRDNAWLSTQALALKSVTKMSHLSNYNKGEIVEMYKNHNVAGDPSYVNNASGSRNLNERGSILMYDDGSKHTLNIIMSSTMATDDAPISAGDSMNVRPLTNQEKADEYNVPAPKDVSGVVANFLTTANTPSSDIRNPNAVKKQYGINDQLNITGENTFDSSQQDLADAYDLALANGNAQSIRGVGPGRTQTKELMLLGDSTSFSDRASAQAACESIGGVLATSQEVINEFTNRTPSLKRPQWHEWGWVSDNNSKKFLVTQEKSLTLPLNQGSWSMETPSTTSKTSTTVPVYTDSVGNTSIQQLGGVLAYDGVPTGGAICKAIKPSETPIVKSATANTNTQEIVMNKKGRYVRVWTAKIPFISSNSDGTCSDTSYDRLTYVENICIPKDAINVIELSQIIIKDKAGANIGKSRGSFVKAVSADTWMSPGDPASLLKDDGTGSWLSRQYMACPRNKGARCQEEVYWQVDLGSSLDIGTVTLIGKTGGSSIKGLRVEVSNSIRPQPYNNSLKKWVWNDMYAFNPPCGPNLQDKICPDIYTKIPEMLCLPSLGGLYKCPSDCEKGFKWCDKKCKCILDLYDWEAWAVMGRKNINVKDYLNADGTVDTPKFINALAMGDAKGKYDHIFFVGQMEYIVNMLSTYSPSRIQDPILKTCAQLCTEGYTKACNNCFVYKQNEPALPIGKNPDIYIRDDTGIKVGNIAEIPWGVGRLTCTDTCAVSKNTTTNKYEIFLQDFRKLSYCPRETSFPPKKFLYKAVTNTLGYVSFSNTWNGANMNVPITGDKNGTLVRDLDQLVVKDVNGNVVRTYPEEFGDYELIRPAHMKKCFQRYTPEQCCKPGDVGCYGSSSCAGDEAWNATEKDASNAARPNSNKEVATN
jgi:hypothetical protein